MKRFSVFIIMLLTVVTAHAQTTVVTGTVLDSLTRKGEPSAIIQFFNDKDLSKPVAYTTTGEEGNFSQALTGKGSYRLLFSNMGRKEKSISFTIEGEQSIDLGDILVEDDVQTLKAGSVTAQKTLVIMEVDKLTYKVCYGEFPVSFFDSVGSKGLKNHLEGCNKAVIFAATVGIGIDRLIARYASISPTKSLLFGAIGAERIEALCEIFNKEYGGARFSPGYGDLPLEFQKEIFRALDCPRKIGLSLNESMLMSPSKSVTAIIGVKNEYQRISEK